MKIDQPKLSERNSHRSGLFVTPTKSEVGLSRNQRVNCCLSGWVKCYGDHYRFFPFIIKQQEKMERCKGLQEYVTLNILNVEKLSKGKYKIL